MITTTDPIRVGLIGAGMIGALRAQAMRPITELRLTAVADVREDLARAAARNHPDVRIFADGGQLAHDENVDAVVISSPPHTHEKLALACFEAGKHVLCEKPLATTVAACENIVRAAEKADVTLATGFNLRYTRAARLARQLFDAGAIGQLDHVRAYHGHPGEQEFTHAWVTDRRVTGGGTLMDNGIHLIDLTRWFLGNVAQSSGFATHHTWRFDGCEDNGFLLLKNDAGRVATLHASWTEWRGYGYRIDLYGTAGYISFGYPPMTLTCCRRAGNGRTTTKKHWFLGYQVLERLRGWEWGLVETLVYDLRGWAHGIRFGSPPITGRDGLEAVRIAQSAQVIDAVELAES